MAFIAPVVAAVGSFVGSAAGIATIATTAVGVGLTIASNNAQSVANQSQAQFQAGIALNNKKIAERNASLASEKSQLEAQRHDQQVRAMIGTQMALQSASGLDVLGRSQLQTREGTAKVGRSAAMDIRLGGDAVVRRYLQDAANYQADASLYGLQGDAAKSQGGWANALAIFDGATNIVDKSLTNKSMIGGSRSTKKSSSNFGGTYRTVPSFGN